MNQTLAVIISKSEKDKPQGIVSIEGMSTPTRSELEKFIRDVFTAPAGRKPKVFFTSKAGLKAFIRQMRTAGVSRSEIRRFIREQVVEVM